MTSLRRPHLLIITGCVFMLLVIGTIAWLVMRDPAEKKQTFEGAKVPGDLVSVEPWSGVHQATVDIWKIEYVSADRHGEPRRATALVSAMADRPKRALPVVAFAHGTVGVAESCAPSDRAKPITTDGGALAAVAAQGAVLVAPDYAGLGSPGPHGFLVGKEAGFDILDAVRAAGQIPELKVSPKTVIWGQSQGGHAALWAGMLQPTHAPDLNLLGVSAAAPPTDLAAMLEFSSDTPVVWRLQAYLLDSWRNVYPDSGLWDEVNPVNKPLIEKIAKRCGNESNGLENQLKPPVLPDFGPGTAFRKLIDQNQPDQLIKAPVLLAQGAMDTVIPAAAQREWAQERCAAGQSIQYVEYPAADHYGVAFAMVTDLLAWTFDRFEGKKPVSTC